MNFASPNWAYLLFILPLLALLKIWADTKALKAVAAFASSERLRAALLGGASPIWSGLHFGLQLLGLGFLFIALTRPQFGEQEKSIEQSGRNIFFAVDTSKSMLAGDVAPDRLTRAKLAAQDLLEKLPGDRVGLIAFAGRAFLQAPLTTDHAAVTEAIQSLDHTSIPRGGSSLAAAVNLALQTVAKMPGKQHGMIIFTDGQETDAAMVEAGKMAAEKNMLILPVGVGTAEGALIPDPNPQNRGDWLRDEDGNVIKTRLEAAALQELARASGGEYIELNSQALTQTLVNRLLSNLDRQKAESQQLRRPIERYQWPLFIGIVCIAMSLIMRPSSRRLVRTAPLPVDPKATVHQPPPLPHATVAGAAMVALLVFSIPVTGNAASLKEVEKARDAYKEGQYEAARDGYKRLSADKEPPPTPREELAYGLGASSLQLKDYDTSTRAFSEALRSSDAMVQRRAQRGLATALYNHGDTIIAKQPEQTIKSWIDARDHFDSAMKITPEGTPEFTELKENRDFVQKRLDELKEQQEQKKKDKDKQKQQGKGQGEPQEQEGEGQQNQEQQQAGDQQGQKKTDAMQKDQGALPEGQIRAGEGGKPDDKQQGSAQPSDEDKRNDQTGFTPQEARSQLRNYADDQKSVQYLMRKESPEGGKDY